jgi:hypothetical protein
LKRTARSFEQSASILARLLLAQALGDWKPQDWTLLHWGRLGIEATGPTGQYAAEPSLFVGVVCFLQLVISTRLSWRCTTGCVEGAVEVAPVEIGREKQDESAGA